MNAHLVQMDIAWEQPEANRRRAAELLDGARIEAGDLVLLPEMFDTGFSFNIERTLDRTGDSTRCIQDLARRYAAWVIGGITSGDEREPRNRAVVASPEGCLETWYDKRRMFPLGSPSERDRLSPGARASCFDWRYGGATSAETEAEGASGSSLRASLAICYDLRFPEVFADGLRDGAEVFAVIANWPAVRHAHWRALLIARAIENQAFVLGVNRSGADPALRYAGGSLVISPLGEVLAEAGEEERVLECPIDAEAVRRWRGKFPAWRER